MGRNRSVGNPSRLLPADNVRIAVAPGDHVTRQIIVVPVPQPRHPVRSMLRLGHRPGSVFLRLAIPKEGADIFFHQSAITGGHKRAERRAGKTKCQREVGAAPSKLLEIAMLSEPAQSSSADLGGPRGL